MKKKEVEKADKDLNANFFYPSNDNVGDWHYTGLIVWNHDVMRTSLNLNELEVIVKDTLNLPHFFG